MIIQFVYKYERLQTLKIFHEDFEKSYPYDTDAFLLLMMNTI